MIDHASETKVFHVTPNTRTERWVVSQEQSQFRKEFVRKGDAVLFATSRARETAYAVVKVHRGDGSTEYVSSYRSERYKSRK